MGTRGSKTHIDMNHPLIVFLLSICICFGFVFCGHGFDQWITDIIEQHRYAWKTCAYIVGGMLMIASGFMILRTSCNKLHESLKNQTDAEKSIMEATSVKRFFVGFTIWLFSIIHIVVIAVITFDKPFSHSFKYHPMEYVATPLLLTTLGVIFVYKSMKDSMKLYK